MTWLLRRVRCTIFGHNFIWLNYVYIPTPPFEAMVCTKCGERYE